MNSLEVNRHPLHALARTSPRSITIVGPLPPPSGGMANQTRQLARLLDTEGANVTVVQTNAAYRPAWVARIRGVRALFRLLPYIWKLWKAAGIADVIHVLANSGWAWHLFAAPAVWIGAMRGVPVVINYRGGDADAFFARSFGRVFPTLRRARAVVVPSPFLRDVFTKYGVSSTIVPNIIDLERFHPAEAFPTNPHIVVTRNLEEIYDIGTAIRAFAIVREIHPGARLTIAGSGSELQALTQLAEQLGVSDAIAFTGHVDNSLLPDLYRSASVVANSSRVDNMPISLLEAMASGVPIVSTNVGGIPYLVEDGISALLVPVAHPESMAAAILRLLAERRLATALRAAGLRVAARYAWPEVRPRLMEIYATCIAGNGGN